MLKSIGISGIVGILFNTFSVSVLAQQAYPTFEQAGFLFELRGCDNTARSDAPLTCEFRIENTEDNRRAFYIYANRSRVVDSEGNEIVGLTANLGNKKESRQVSTDLIKKIPVSGTITFEKAPQGKILLVDLYCYGTGANYFNVEFPFTQ